MATSASSALSASTPTFARLAREPGDLDRAFEVRFRPRVRDPDRHRAAPADCAAVLPSILAAMRDRSASGSMPAHAPAPAAAPTLLETVDALPPAPAEPIDPLKIGRYTVLRHLGEGGMGTVWSAYDETLDRRVAIKVLSGRHHSEQSRGRMLREAKALARLNHPNVVQVFEVGELGDDLFVAMEFIRGESLAQWLVEPHPFPEILAAFVQAGRGLVAVHQAKLVHRDFKPDNVVVGDDGRVRLIDFGIARLDGDDPDPTIASAPRDLELAEVSADRLTRTGQFIGTPAFTSPEQLRGLIVDPRADQFSFCVSLFRAAYHVAPFAGTTVAAVAVDVMQGHIVDPPRPAGVPAGLRPILAKGLARDPADRHADMATLLAALERLGSRRRGAMLAIVAAAIAGAGLTAAIVLPRGESCDSGPLALAPVWNDARARTIGTEFGSAGAADAWAHARAGIGEFAEAWIEQHHDACTLHRRGEQSSELLDRRMACLELGKRDLDALLVELAQFDATLVPIVGEAIAKLPNPVHCGDLEQLGDRAISPPSDAESAAQVGELETVLARAQAQERAGRIPRARATLEEVREQVTALAYVPLQLQLHGLAAVIDQQEGRHLEAQREHQSMFELAVAHRVDDDTLEAALALAASIGVHQGRVDDAEAWVSIADAWIVRSGEPVLARAMWREIVAGIRERQGRFDESRALLEQAIASLDGVPRRDALRPLAILHNELGFVNQRQRRWDEAEQAFIRGREHWLELLGPQHPVTTEGLNNLGSLYLAMERPDDAQRAFEQVLAEREAIFGHDHPKVAHILHNLGSTADRRHDRVRAIAYYREALDILERSLGREDPAVAVVLGALGEAHTALEQPEAALVYLERAREIDERALGPDHPELAWDLNAIANANNSLGRHAAALVAAERALAIREQSGPSPDRVGQTRFERAKALAGLGRLDEGRAAAARAIEEYAVEPHNQARIRAWLDALPAKPR
jgi:eukaryotic-like serine/threonine-protein kinase